MSLLRCDGNDGRIGGGTRRAHIESLNHSPVSDSEERPLLHMLWDLVPALKAMVMLL